MAKIVPLSSYTITIDELRDLLKDCQFEQFRQHVVIYKRNRALFSFPTYDGKVSAIDIDAALR